MNAVLSGATRVAAVIGHPIAHTRSPAIFNAAFAAAGLDWVFVAFDVDEPDGMAAIRGAAALGIAGLSVTMPLKEVAAAAADRLTPVAERLGAVNSMRFEHDELVGDNTDGDGFVDAITAAGWSPAGRRFAVLGAGGAARAVILAVAGAGAAEVAVVNRTPARAEAAASLAGRVGRVADAGAVAGADVVVNATPQGMGGRHDEGWPGAIADAVGPGQAVVDLVYHPLHTALLEAAAARGAATVDGLGMLVHQAGHQFRRWTGEAPPLEAMAAALI